MQRVVPMKGREGGSRSPRLAAAGLALGVLGVVGYFVVVFRFGAWLPSIRNDAVPNLILVALGVGLSALAVLRTTRRLVPGLLLGLNVAVAALFLAILYVISAVPPAAGPPLGAPAPGFALVDQSGKTVRLEDFRGAPVLLVFYRGHW
jgi:peptidoglycan/LPS O-acetylase OafA/YrhL